MSDARSRISLPNASGHFSMLQNSKFQVPGPRVGTAWAIGACSLEQTSGVVSTVVLRVNGEMIDTFPFAAAGQIFHPYQPPFVLFDGMRLEFTTGGFGAGFLDVDWRFNLAWA